MRRFFIILAVFPAILLNSCSKSISKNQNNKIPADMEFAVVIIPDEKHGIFPDEKRGILSDTTPQVKGSYISSFINNSKTYLYGLVSENVDLMWGYAEPDKPIIEDSSYFYYTVDGFTRKRFQVDLQSKIDNNKLQPKVTVSDLTGNILLIAAKKEPFYELFGRDFFEIMKEREKEFKKRMDQFNKEIIDSKKNK